MTSVFYSCAHPLCFIIALPGNLPGIFPDCGFLIRLETEPETRRRNVTETPVSPTWASQARKWVPGPPGPETSFVTSRVATFDHEIKTWFGLGKSGAGDTDGNGLKTGIAVLTSLPVSLPGIFPDCGFFDSRFLSSRFSSRNLPGSSRIAVF